MGVWGALPTELLSNAFPSITMPFPPMKLAGNVSPRRSVAIPQQHRYSVCKQWVSSIAAAAVAGRWPVLQRDSQLRTR